MAMRLRRISPPIRRTIATVPTCRAAVAGGLGCLLAAATAMAAPLNSAFVGNFAGSAGCVEPVGPVVGSGPVTTGPISCGSADGVGVLTGKFSATADAGRLQGYAEVTLVPAPFYSSANSGAASALTSAEYVFAGPGSHVMARLNLDISGRLDATGAGGNAGFRVAMNAGSDFFHLSVREFADGSREDVGTLAPGADYAALFAPGGGVVHLTSVPFRVPIGQPYPLTLDFAAFARTASTGNSVPGQAMSDVVLAFSLDLPAFDLPEGFSVSGPGIRMPGTAIPEPASLSLFLASGLLLLGAARSRGGQPRRG